MLPPNSLTERISDNAESIGAILRCRAHLVHRTGSPFRGGSRVLLCVYSIAHTKRFVNRVFKSFSSFEYFGRFAQIRRYFRL